MIMLFSQFKQNNDLHVLLFLEFESSKKAKRQLHSKVRLQNVFFLKFQLSEASLQSTSESITGMATPCPRPIFNSCFIFVHWQSPLHTYSSTYEFQIDTAEKVWSLPLQQHRDLRLNGPFAFHNRFLALMVLVLKKKQRLDRLHLEEDATTIG